jgi:hypothetical protein
MNNGTSAFNNQQWLPESTQEIIETSSKLNLFVVMYCRKITICLVATEVGVPGV